MKDNSNIEDWYKNELSNYEVTPDEGGWNSVADKLDMSDSPPSLTENNIEGWYKNEIKNVEATPDQQVWNKLSTNLDVQNVWTRVFNSLNRYDRMIWWRNFTLRTAALLMLLFGSYLTYNTINPNISKSNIKGNPLTINNSKSSVFSQQKTRNKKQKTSNSSLLTVGSPQLANNKQQTTSSKTPVIRNKKPETSNKKQETQNSKPETPLYASLSMEKFSPKKVESIHFDFEESTIYSSEQQGVDLNTKTLELKEFLVKKEKNKIIFNDKRFSSHFVFGMYARRFYVGLNGGFKNQNLITKIKSTQNLKEQQRLDFGYTFGGTIGIIMSDKLNLESNINFISTSGYNRRYEMNDIIYNEDLNLNYTTISVLAKKMSNKSTFDNKKYSTNLFGGIYAGYLTSANVVSGNNTYNVSNEFKNLDLGIVLGLEQDRYLTKQIIITPGIRYTQGVINIANESNPYEAARTFAIEFNIGMKYIFLKKNK
ncbi:MAG: PorT family protein [Bacteroidetes bacterium]|nr:PorT family protein [Bacteroidota bacterium]